MRKTLLLIFGTLFTLAVFSPSFAQDQKPPEGPFLKSQSASSEEQSQYADKLITAVEIHGNKSISSNTVISKMKSRIGNPYQENIVSDDLKRLYLLGFFTDIKIDTEAYKDGVKLMVTVAERPIIEKITFSGIVHITLKDDKLKEQLKSKEGQYLDYPNLSEDLKTLKKLYEKIGYNQAQVEHVINVDKERNKATVEFKISENRRVTIKEITVEGNKDFSANRILRLLKTKSGWLFNAGVLKEEVLKEDMERVRSFYRKNGFADVSVEYEIKSDLKKPYLLYITIKVQEGKKYLVGNVTIKGDKDVAQKEIISKLSQCIPGKVYSGDNLKQDVSSIQGLYFDRGYISCQIQESTFLNPETGRIDINYNITENSLAYVSKIKIRGNVKTRDMVVRRELRIYPGDKIDGDKLRRSKERLQNLGFFEEISYDTEETQESDKKDLIVDVKESKTGNFSFGGGYSTVDQFVGFGEIEQKNFDWKSWPYFTGGGQDLKFRGSFGSLSSSYEMSFTNPWIFDYPVSFGFDVYKRDHSRDSDVGYGYDEKVGGGDIRFGKELTEYIKGNITYRFDSITIGSVTEDATNDLRKEVGTNKISSVLPELTFDSRNNVFETTSGNLLANSLEWAGGPFFGDKKFWKYFLRASHYVPFAHNSALEFRGRVGLADGYGGDDSLPIYERFFAGGASTIRGYNERKIGPIDGVSKDPLGGNSLLIANMEYTYPVLSFVKLAAFYDVGNVWEKMNKVGTGGFKSGIGLGVRLKTPIGPIMLDYGIPLNTEPGETERGSGKFHFSASHGF